MTTKKTISCPTCGKLDTWQADNRYRPFCTDRCKLIDLGEWARESRKIAGQSLTPDAPDSDNEAY